METEETKSQTNLDPTLQYSEQLKASDPALSEETAKDLGILAHSLYEGLNNMFKDIFKSNGDSWRLAEEKEENSLTWTTVRAEKKHWKTFLLTCTNQVQT